MFLPWFKQMVDIIMVKFPNNTEYIEKVKLFFVHLIENSDDE